MTNIGKGIAIVIGGLITIGLTQQLVEKISYRVNLEAKFIYLSFLIWIGGGFSIYFSISNGYLDKNNLILSIVGVLISPVFIIYIGYFFWKLLRLFFLYIFKFMKWSLQGLNELEKKIDK